MPEQRLAFCWVVGGAAEHALRVTLHTPRNACIPGATRNLRRLSSCDRGSVSAPAAKRRTSRAGQPLQMHARNTLTRLLCARRFFELQTPAMTSCEAYPPKTRSNCNTLRMYVCGYDHWVHCCPAGIEMKESRHVRCRTLPALSFCNVLSIPLLFCRGTVSLRQQRRLACAASSQSAWCTSHSLLTRCLLRLMCSRRYAVPPAAGDDTTTFSSTRVRQQAQRCLLALLFSPVDTGQGAHGCEAVRRSCCHDAAGCGRVSASGLPAR